MKKVIILPHGCIRKLADQFHCSRYTVSDALRTDKPGAKKDLVRKYVLEKHIKKEDGDNQRPDPDKIIR